MSLKSRLKELEYSYYMSRLSGAFTLHVKKSLNTLKSQGKLLELSRQQKKEIIDYYYDLTGKKIQTLWHQYYYSRSGKFSVKYLPENFYNTDLIYRINNFDMRKFYSDKNQYDLLFPEINKPFSYLKRINGYYYYDNQVISPCDAVRICQNLPLAIIKPTIETTWGENVNQISTKAGYSSEFRRSIEDIFNLYGDNFIIQEKIKQHENISALNPHSVNTIRVFSIRRGDQIDIISACLRIGRTESIVDNARAGGMFVNLNDKGEINSVGYEEDSMGVFTESTTKVSLLNYKIPGYLDVILNIKKMHEKVPYLNLIGWDFSVDENEKAVFVELNRCPDICLFQSATGPALGEYQDLLGTVKTKPNTRSFNIF